VEIVRHFHHCQTIANAADYQCCFTRIAYQVGDTFEIRIAGLHGMASRFIP
jgi:hypothetical protein